MAIDDLIFTDEEMAIEQAIGYPQAYAKLCRDSSFSPFSHGPPFTFTPYSLPHQEEERAKELDEMFPIIDRNAKPTKKPKIFVSLLWKKLNHLGNAGFDPEIFRVDPYGNVLYYHADSASPLAWDIDHWFPCSRGGLTVPSNLRILQWQVCKKKHNKLEFLIPWWDFQAGISINQFISIFASTNSDFRHRAFSWLFYQGESEELNASQTVDSHCFPQHFIDSQEKLGLAPAAVVLAPSKQMDHLSTRPRSTTPIIAARKMKHVLRENQDPNSYQAIVMARDSLKQREETVKMQAEIRKLDNEVTELQQKAQEEKVSIQDLELLLTRRRRRAEKCRRLAEEQSSYRAMLEKMIRDAMHQSVVYKEQVRLNQAATSALLARLEAQKAICDSAEREVHRKYRQRDELEKQMRPILEKPRKRSRMDYMSIDTSHKELWKFLEEDQKPLDESILTIKEQGEEDEGQLCDKGRNEINDNVSTKTHKEDEESRNERGKGNLEKWVQFLLENTQQTDAENGNENETEELIRKLISPEREIIVSRADEPETTENMRHANENETDELIRKLDLMSPEKETISSRAIEQQTTESINAIANVANKDTTAYKNNPPYRVEQRRRSDMSEAGSTGIGVEQPGISEENVRTGKIQKERGLFRSESARALRRIPSSPSMILGSMKRRVDCIRKKPMVLDDDAGDEVCEARKSFIISSIKTIKRAVKM